MESKVDQLNARMDLVLQNTIISMVVLLENRNSLRI